MAKLFTILVLVLTIILFGGYAATSAAPDKMPANAVLAKNVIDFAKMQGSIRKLDRDDMSVKAVAAVTRLIYSEQVARRLVVVPPDVWNYYVVTGEKALYLSKARGMAGMTDWQENVVFILDMPGYNQWTILSHELVHVYQTEDGLKIVRMSAMEVEYQAEVVSRWTMVILGALIVNDKLPTKELSFGEWLVALGYLQELLKHG